MAVDCFTNQAIESAPPLAYLYEHITPRYAADWRVIGTLLGIPNEELKIIEASYPTNLKWCCNQMLAKWIEIDPTASFEKLFAAIHSSAVSGLHKDNAISDSLSLSDLYKHVTPRYAADWRVIGTLLGIPVEELDAIEGGYPTNFKWCCNKMLEKWVELDPTASWEKLLPVIYSPVMSSTSSENVPDGYQCSPQPCKCKLHKVTDPNSLHRNEQLESIRLYHSFHVAGDVQKCRTVEQYLCFKHTIDQRIMYFIDLHGNILGEDLERVAVFIYSSTIEHWTEVNLSNCGINDSNIHLLFQRLHEDNDITIKVLQLNYNGLTKKHSSWISDLTVDYRIQKLSVNGNHGIGQSKQLYCMLTNPDTNLATLHMEGVNLSDNDVHNLFTAVQHNDTLKELNVNDNNITDCSCPIIATSLQSNTSLVKLWMSKNPISGEACKLILEDLKHNNSLRQLTFCYYGENIQRSIEILQQGINKTREDHKCLVELTINFI